MEQITRIPRPMGLTLQGHNLSIDPTNKELIKKFRRTLIKAFINHNLYYPQEALTQLPRPKQNTKKKSKNTITLPTHYMNRTIGHITIEQLSLALGISVNGIISRVHKILHQETEEGYKITNKDIMADNARAVFFEAFFGALGRHQAVKDWAEELKAVGRNFGYSALHIKEANSAIGNELGYLKTIAELAIKAQTFGTKQTTESAPNSQTPGNINGHYLTTTSAIKLLEEHGAVKPIVDLDLNMIALKNGLQGPGVVDVKAIPSDAQGVKAFEAKDFAYIGHEDRRHETEQIEDAITIDD